MARLNKERAIVASKKEEAHRAYYNAQNQRTEMMLHFSRMQEKKDQERIVSENLRQSRREATFELGNEILMLSTKAANDNKKIYDVPDEIIAAES